MGQVDFNNLTPKEQSIVNNHFLDSKEVLEQRILDYRQTDEYKREVGVLTSESKSEEPVVNTKQVVQDITNSEAKHITDGNIVDIKNTNDIAKSSEQIMQRLEMIIGRDVQEIATDPVKLEALSASLGCKRLYNKAYKEDATDEDLGIFIKELHNRIYPESIKDVIKQATQYTSQGTVIDGKDKASIINAINSSLCLIIQLSTKGNVTAFIGTNSYNVIRDLYGDEYYIAAITYATTHAILDSFKEPKEAKDYEKKPNLHKVLSGSLRIKAVNKEDYDLSATSYTWNEDKTVAVIMLDNPKVLGNQLHISLENASKNPPNHLVFDMGIYNALANSPTYETAVGLVAFAQTGDYKDNALTNLKGSFDYWEGIKNRGYLSNLNK